MKPAATLLSAGILLAIGLPHVCLAGTFLGFGQNNPDLVIHAGGTNQGGGVRLVQVCLNPAKLPTPDANPAFSDPEQAIRNVVAEFNRMQGTNGNVVSAASAGVTGGRSDFESVALHELGHCIGLDHSVLGPSEVGTSDFNNPQLYYMNTFAGPNTTFNTDDGVDNVRASRDDARGDDVNRNWFRVGVNDPFAALPVTVDQTTYSHDVTDLPGTHAFPEAATHFLPCSNGGSTSNLRGQSPTSAVMYPVLCTNNAVRQLSLDDVATLRIGEAGNNGTAGNSDDYTIQMNYKGKTTTGCDITIEFRTGVGFGICNVSASGAGNNFTITTGNAGFEITEDWYFNQTDTTGSGPGPNDIFANGFE
ncbi:MAG: hypothetical protein R3F12_07490 [Lysobacteraceae bacterium]|nr:hypothetical protein [Xanthomonadaceae bacterium]HRX98669.1 hypothetical protein [Xanthomonadaceae bacterium]